MLSNFAFNFDLRRYNKDASWNVSVDLLFAALVPGWRFLPTARAHDLEAHALLIKARQDAIKDKKQKEVDAVGNWLRTISKLQYGFADLDLGSMVTPVGWVHTASPPHYTTPHHASLLSTALHTTPQHTVALASPMCSVV